MKSRWLARDLESWREAGRKPVLVLTGARQVGKTTLARSLTDERFSYLALDDPILRSDLATLGAEAFARRFPRAILDEIQKIPDLIEVVKAIVDRGGSERYLLLGSSHVLLMERSRESLVGRTQLRRLWPLALSEVLADTGSLGPEPAPPPALLELLRKGPEFLHELPGALSLHPRAGEIEIARNDFLDRGGMPALWTGDPSGPEIREELETYVSLYLERDLADLARLRDLQPFVRLQRLAAERTAGLLNTSELARDAGIAPATAAQYLRYLELSFQAFLLPPFHANRSKRLVKSSVLHWTDPGIWRAVTRRWGGLSGELYESAIVAEVLKVLDAFRLDWEPFHLRTYDGREVDLLLVRGDEAIAIEIKAGERANRQDARHLFDLEEVTGLRPRFGLVVTRGREVRQLGDGVWAVPDGLLLAPPG